MQGMLVMLAKALGLGLGRFRALLALVQAREIGARRILSAPESRILVTFPSCLVMG